MPVFEGVWSVADATLPGGAFAYTGTITVGRWGQVYSLDWDISAGRYVGIGLLVGERLFVACGEQFAGLGLALYRCGAGGEGEVTWTTAELGGAVGTGTLTTAADDVFVGQHELVQRLPDGQPHGAWALLVEQSDEVYRLTWRKGESVHWHGLGLATAEGLAVGWYPDLGQLAFLEYVIDGTDGQSMAARWALGGHAGLGSERLTRCERNG